MPPLYISFNCLCLKVYLITKVNGRISGNISIIFSIVLTASAPFFLKKLISTLTSVSFKVHLIIGTFGKAIGWALATLGMILLFVYSIISGNIIYAIVTLLFAIANAHFSIDCFKEYKK